MIILISDGLSDDNFDQQAAILNERLHIKIAAIVTKKFYRERLLPIVRYDDAIFTLAQIEALSNWLWNQQVNKFIHIVCKILIISEFRKCGMRKLAALLNGKNLF